MISALNCERAGNIEWLKTQRIEILCDDMGCHNLMSAWTTTMYVSVDRSNREVVNVIKLTASLLTAVAQQTTHLQPPYTSDQRLSVTNIYYTVTTKCG